MPTPSESGRARARAVRRAFEAAGLPPGDVLAVTVPDGREVQIEALSVTEDGARSSVEVRLAGSTEGGDPNFVIVNPPTLVPDPMGDKVIRGMRYREDPLRALAQAIADNGGAVGGSKRRRRT